MQKKTKFSKFNDGIAKIYREKISLNSFGAKENVKGLSNLDFVCKLNFEQLSRREQDQEFANAIGHKLSLKIRTRYFSNMDSNYKVLISDIIYDIYDIDIKANEMYLYLEESRKLKC